MALNWVMKFQYKKYLVGKTGLQNTFLSKTMAHKAGVLGPAWKIEQNWPEYTRIDQKWPKLKTIYDEQMVRALVQLILALYFNGNSGLQQLQSLPGIDPGIENVYQKVDLTKMNWQLGLFHPNFRWAQGVGKSFDPFDYFPENLDQYDFTWIDNQVGKCEYYIRICNKFAKRGGQNLHQSTVVYWARISECTHQLKLKTVQK